MTKFAARGVLDHVAHIWSSGETKAIESANILAERLKLTVQVEEELHENDRSATGFLPPPEFETTADQFFAQPNESIRGWERAVDAQARIIRAVDRVIAASPNGDIAIVAHGGVGTLLMCAHLRSPISRRFDQPHQGHYWCFTKTRAVLHQWKPI
ncbi:MAG: phosphoglycerate mutase family protein [Hyphomonadaceae bacterium JAD_PAG50586_4]|nr:MAG: phosphoglycerate mutase family protein [Hyphomonadaceae bacterium JAD_PAG50586_4]